MFNTENHLVIVKCREMFNYHLKHLRHHHYHRHHYHQI